MKKNIKQKLIFILSALTILKFSVLFAADDLPLYKVYLSGNFLYTSNFFTDEASGIVYPDYGTNRLFLYNNNRQQLEFYLMVFKKDSNNKYAFVDPAVDAEGLYKKVHYSVSRLNRGAYPLYDAGSTPAVPYYFTKSTKDNGYMREACFTGPGNGSTAVTGGNYFPSSRGAGCYNREAEITKNHFYVVNKPLASAAANQFFLSANLNSSDVNINDSGIDTVFSGDYFTLSFTIDGISDDSYLNKALNFDVISAYAAINGDGNNLNQAILQVATEDGSRHQYLTNNILAQGYDPDKFSGPYIKDINFIEHSALIFSYPPIKEITGVKFKNCSDDDSSHCDAIGSPGPMNYFNVLSKDFAFAVYNINYYGLPNYATTDMALSGIDIYGNQFIDRPLQF